MDLTCGSVGPEHVLCVFCARSARGQDAAAAGGVEEGLGRSGELHLWPEGRLQPPLPGSESCDVSHCPPGQEEKSLFSQFSEENQNVSGAAAADDSVALFGHNHQSALGH